MFDYREDALAAFGLVGAFDYEPSTGVFQADEGLRRLYGVEEGAFVDISTMMSSFARSIHPDDRLLTTHRWRSFVSGDCSDLYAPHRIHSACGPVNVVGRGLSIEIDGIRRCIGAVAKIEPPRSETLDCRGALSVAHRAAMRENQPFLIYLISMALIAVEK